MISRISCAHFLRARARKREILRCAQTTFQLRNCIIFSIYSSSSSSSSSMIVPCWLHVLRDLVLDLVRNKESKHFNATIYILTIKLQSITYTPHWITKWNITSVINTRVRSQFCLLCTCNIFPMYATANGFISRMKPARHTPLLLLLFNKISNKTNTEIIFGLCLFNLLWLPINRPVTISFLLCKGNIEYEYEYALLCFALLCCNTFIAWSFSIIRSCCWSSPLDRV